MFSVSLYKLVPVLQPDEFNKEIQRRGDMLSQEGGISTCCSKNEQKKDVKMGK